jgi:DNA-binding PadR family transcriptional regulator
VTIGQDKKTWVKTFTALYILKLLCAEPTHGNSISSEIRRRTKDIINPNPNALYPLLRELEEKGFIVGEWASPEKRAKRVYHITTMGRGFIPHLTKLVRNSLTELEARINVLKRDLLCD